MKITKTHLFIILGIIMIISGSLYYRYRENYQCCGKSLGIVTQEEIDQECRQKCQSGPENCVYHPQNDIKFWDCYSRCLGKPCSRMI